MKRIKLRTLVAVCLAIALLGGALTVFSLAQESIPTVVYDHAQKGFEFLNVAPYGEGQEHKYPDLFTDFKNMMPGDSSEPQKIRVKVNNANGGTVYLYLRTEPVNEDITEQERQAFDTLMQYAQLNVYQNNQPLDTATLADGGVLLGKFHSGDSTELEVELGIDISAGSKPGEQELLQGLRAEIGWVFTAEYHQDPVKPVGPSKPALDMGDHYAYIVGYPDGLVHPERQITRGETATIFFRMLTEESRQEFWSQVNPYYDVTPEDWFNNAISTLTYAGILNGYPDGTFRPEANITRAEFAAMAVRFFEGDGEEPAGDAFPDIRKHWANAEINLAYAKGIIEGYPDGTFRPDQQITRAEAVTIVNRVLERYPHKDHLLEDMIRWPDNLDTDAWYYADVQEATNSHSFDMLRDEEDEPYEVWTELLPVRDWTALEREWSEYDSSRSPGEVVSSKDAALFKD